MGGSIGCAGSGVSTSGAQIGVGDGGVGETGDGDDVACARFVEPDPLETAEGKHLRHPSLLDQLAGMVEHLDRLVRGDGARGDAAGNDAAKIGICLQNRAEQPERALLDLGR